MVCLRPPLLEVSGRMVSRRQALLACQAVCLPPLRLEHPDLVFHHRPPQGGSDLMEAQHHAPQECLGLEQGRVFRRLLHQVDLDPMALQCPQLLAHHEVGCHLHPLLRLRAQACHHQLHQAPHRQVRLHLLHLRVLELACPRRPPLGVPRRRRDRCHHQPPPEVPCRSALYQCLKLLAQASVMDTHPRSPVPLPREGPSLRRKRQHQMRGVRRLFEAWYPLLRHRASQELRRCGQARRHRARQALGRHPCALPRQSEIWTRGRCWWRAHPPPQVPHWRRKHSKGASSWGGNLAWIAGHLRAASRTRMRPILGHQVHLQRQAHRQMRRRAQLRRPLGHWVLHPVPAH